MKPRQPEPGSLWHNIGAQYLVMVIKGGPICTMLWYDCIGGGCGGPIEWTCDALDMFCTRLS